MPRYLAVSMALFAALSLSLGRAQAQDDNYMLGTTLVLSSPSQLIEPNQGWWADLLPLDYTYGMINIVNAVNESRRARGISSMVDVKTYPVAIGGEMQVDSGWEYTIDFNRMSIADVEAVLAAFPLTGRLADTSRSFRPMNYGYVYGHGDGASPAVLNWEGESISINWGESFDSIQGKVAAMLARLAPDATFDLSLNQYQPASGVKSLDVSVSIYLNGASPQMPVPYAAEGGM